MSNTKPVAEISDGPTIRMAGRDYIVPPITLGMLQKFEPTLEKIAKLSGSGKGPEAMKLGIPIIGAAIRRNYPGITDADVAELVDLGSYSKCINAAMGLPPDTKIKGVPVGEAVPVVAG